MGESQVKGEVKPTLTGIQMLRGCAAIMVVLTHDNAMMQFPRYFQKGPFHIEDAGVFGVSVFFVISGFIIAYVSLGRDLKPKFSVRDYALRRFLRIIPFLWLCIFGYNILSFTGTREFDWMSTLRTMLIWPVGELKPNVVWSLRHELLFYVLFAIAMMGKQRRVWLLGLWFAAPLLYGGLLLVTNAVAAPPNSVWADLLALVLNGGDMGANLQFCAGFTLAMLWLRGSPVTATRLPMGLPVTLVTLVAATVLVEVTALLPGLARSLLWTVLSALIVWLGLISLPSQSWIQKLGIALGDASFAIYLIHNGVLLVLLEGSRHFQHAAPLWLFFLAFAVIAIGVGVLVHQFIEAPLIQWLAHGRRVVTWQAGVRRAP